MHKKGFKIRIIYVVLRISSGCVLVIGALLPTGNEIIKNLVLTGISTLLILRGSQIKDNCSFFLSSVVNDSVDLYQHLVEQLTLLNPSVCIKIILEQDMLPEIDCIVHCNQFFLNLEEFSNV